MLNDHQHYFADKPITFQPMRHKHVTAQYKAYIGVSKLPVQAQAGTITGTLIGSHTHGWCDVVLWQNG